MFIEQHAISDWIQYYFSVCLVFFSPLLDCSHDAYNGVFPVENILRWRNNKVGMKCVYASSHEPLNRFENKKNNIMLFSDIHFILKGKK